MRVVTTCTKAFGQQHMERICIREPLNANDRYAVALKKDGAVPVVGHLPQKISRICALFMHLSKFCPTSPHAGKRGAKPGD